MEAFSQNYFSREFVLKRKTNEVEACRFLILAPVISLRCFVNGVSKVVQEHSITVAEKCCGLEAPDL